MKWTHQRTAMSRLSLCISCRKTTQSRPSLISSLSWSISASTTPPCFLSHTAGYSCQKPSLWAAPSWGAVPSAQAPSLSLPPPSWPQPREATPGEPSSDQPAVHPSSVVHTSVPEHCSSLPAAAAWVTPPQERPSPFPSLHTQPSLTAPLSLGSPQAVPSTGNQQLAFTVSQPPAQVPASISGKVQHGEYIDLSELLMCDFQYRYSRLDDGQMLKIVDGKLSLALKPKSRHLSMLQIWSKVWHIYEDTVLSFFPKSTRSCCIIGTTLWTLTNTSTGQQCSAMMHNSSKNVSCRGFPSVPLINSCMWPC